MKNNETDLFIGTYSRPAAHAPEAKGRGIVQCTFDPVTGQIEEVGCHEDILSPSYLCLDKEKVFAVSETPESGALHVLSRAEEGLLSPTDRIPLRASGYCHVASHQQQIFLSSYADGLLATIDMPHSSGKATASYVQFDGKGPDHSRQAASHIHQAVVAPGGRWLYVVDLGGDEVWTCGIGSPTEKISAFHAPPGSGPRHLVIHPELPVVYIWCELKPLLLTCTMDSENGTLSLIDTFDLSTHPDSKDAMDGSAIKIHPTGTALYVAERNTHSICSFTLDAAGHPAPAGRMPTGGKVPRDFSISPCGDWMVIANQNSDTLVSVKLDPTDQMPIQDQRIVTPLETPVCVCFGE